MPNPWQACLPKGAQPVSPEEEDHHAAPGDSVMEDVDDDASVPALASDDDEAPMDMEYDGGYGNDYYPDEEDYRSDTSNSDGSQPDLDRLSDEDEDPLPRAPNAPRPKVINVSGGGGISDVVGTLEQLYTKDPHLRRAGLCCLGLPSYDDDSCCKLQEMVVQGLEEHAPAGVRVLVVPPFATDHKFQTLARGVVLLLVPASSVDLEAEDGVEPTERQIHNASTEFLSHVFKHVCLQLLKPHALRMAEKLRAAAPSVPGGRAKLANLMGTIAEAIEDGPQSHIQPAWGRPPLAMTHAEAANWLAGWALNVHECDGAYAAAAATRNSAERQATTKTASRSVSIDLAAVFEPVLEVLQSEWRYSMDADSYCGPEFFKPNRLVLGTAWAMIIQRDGHLDKTRLTIQLQLGDALELARLALLVHGLRSKRVRLAVSASSWMRPDSLDTTGANAILSINDRDVIDVLAQYGLHPGDKTTNFCAEDVATYRANVLSPYRETGVMSNITADGHVGNGRNGDYAKYLRVGLVSANVHMQDQYCELLHEAGVTYSRFDKKVKGERRKQETVETAGRHAATRMFAWQQDVLVEAEHLSFQDPSISPLDLALQCMVLWRHTTDGIPRPTALMFDRKAVSIEVRGLGITSARLPLDQPSTGTVQAGGNELAIVFHANKPLLSAASAGQGKTFVGLSALKSKTSEKSSHVMEAGCVVVPDGDGPSLALDLYDAISLERHQFTSPGGRRGSLVPMGSIMRQQQLPLNTTKMYADGIEKKMQAVETLKHAVDLGDLQTLAHNRLSALDTTAAFLWQACGPFPQLYLDRRNQLVLEALHALLSTLGDGQVLELVDHDSTELWGLVEAVFCCDFEGTVANGQQFIQYLFNASACFSFHSPKSAKEGDFDVTIFVPGTASPCGVAGVGLLTLESTNLGFGDNRAAKGRQQCEPTIRHTKPVQLGWLRYAYSGASPAARLETLADALHSAEAAAGHPESEHYLVPRKEYGPHTGEAYAPVAWQAQLEAGETVALLCPLSGGPAVVGTVSSPLTKRVDGEPFRVGVTPTHTVVGPEGRPVQPALAAHAGREVFFLCGTPWLQRWRAGLLPEGHQLLAVEG